METRNKYLIVAAASSAIAASLHLGCIFFGGNWYRFFGAGEQMARMAENGHWYPTVATLIISTVLILWSLYALSGAGIIRRLPLLKIGLCIIASIYLLRGIGFVFIIPYFPGNSLTFWFVSSLICVAIGLSYAIGIAKSWSYIEAKNA